MQDLDWSQLQKAFSPNDLEWRIVDLSDDRTRANVRPQLRFEAVVQRLDEVLGKTAWSNTYAKLEENLISCALNLNGVTKTGLAKRTAFVESDVTARDALVQAAEMFGMSSQLEETNSWVDYDAEAGTILYEPEALESTDEAPPKPTALITPPQADKPEGQQVIDKLVERLKLDGKGLETAKLLVTYGGYGDNPEAARELYSKLRQLLKSEGAPSGVSRD